MLQPRKLALKLQIAFWQKDQSSEENDIICEKTKLLLYPKIARTQSLHLATILLPKVRVIAKVEEEEEEEEENGVTSGMAGNSDVFPGDSMPPGCLTMIQNCFPRVLLSTGMAVDGHCSIIVIIIAYAVCL